MISMLTAVAGSSLIFWALFISKLRKRMSAEEIFPDSRPRWLFFFSWFYLTLAIGCWFALIQQLNAAGSLAAAIVTLAAAKFICFYFFYFKLLSVLRLAWESRPGLLFLQISLGISGVFMLIIAELVRL